MKAKNKDTLLCILILLIATLMIVFGGAYERGYFWPAAETMLIPLGILWIVERRKMYE
jgi:hypothetical protein